MMMSPHSLIMEHENDSFEELIELRDEIYAGIKNLEKMAYDKSKSDKAWMINPSPEVIYQVELEYLITLSQFIKKKYHNEIVCSYEADENA